MVDHRGAASMLRSAQVASCSLRRPWLRVGSLAVGNGPSRQLPARPDEVARVPGGVALQVILVLGLGLPEVAGGADFGHHFAGPQAGRFDVGDGVERDALLLVVEVEDRGAVAGPEVVALPVLGGRIMDLE